jgi:hypothetical protein
MFFVRATDVLMASEPNRIAVNRLATIFENIVVHGETECPEMIGFLSKLINSFIAEQSVFELFKKICGESSNLLSLLQSCNFASLIEKELMVGGAADKVANLCCLVGVCLKNPKLASSFCSERLLAVLANLLYYEDLRVVDQSWECLSLVCNETTAQKMLWIYETALTMVSKEVSSVRMHHVHIFDFLERFVRWAGNLIEGNGLKVFNRILEMITKFPECTNLMGPMFKLMRRMCNSSKFLGTFGKVVLPVLLELGKSEVRNAASANALRMLADIETVSAKNRVVNEMLAEDMPFSKFREDRLKTFLTEMTRAFGGPILKYTEKKKSRSGGGVGKGLLSYDVE